MSQKFKDIFSNSFGRTTNIRKIPNKNAYCIQTSINTLWYAFKTWNKIGIPTEISNNKILFGAYLAGIIDGDGTVKIKNNKDRVIPQYVVKIASDHPLREIKILIRKYLDCSTYFEYDNRSNGVNTCFYLSQKNICFIKDNVYPHIELLHKKERFEKYFKLIR